MWRDANPHCCKIISLAHNGMNWCDLYWFSSWDDDTSLHSFFIQRVWLAVHLHFDAPRKTNPEIQAWCTTKPKSKLDSFNSSNLGPVFKPLPENYPLNKKLTFTHFQWDPTISNSMAWIFLSFSQGEKLLLFQLDPRSVTSFPAQLRFLAWQCHGQTWSLNQPLMVMGGCQRLQCVPEKHFPIIVANKNILYSWGMGYHGYQHWYMTVQRLLSPVMTFPMEIIQTWGLWTEMSQLGTREWTALIPDIWLTWTILRSLWYPSAPNGLYKENALTFFLSTLLQKFKTRLVWRFGEDEIRSENKGNGGILC